MGAGNNALLQYLNRDTSGGAPEQQAYQNALGPLQHILSGAGAGVLDPLTASFHQNLQDQLSQLNASTPGRFSTANLYQQGQTRQRAMNDFNLMGSNLLQQGAQNQLGAANTLGALAGNAGQASFGRAATATGLGQQQTGMAQQQQMQALMALLGPALGPAFGGPFTQGSSPFESLLGGGSILGQLFGGGGRGSASLSGAINPQANNQDWWTQYGGSVGK